MAKQTFTTGQVLTASQMSSLQATAMGGGSPSVKTTSYVLVAADAGTVIQMNSASATTITVNTSLFSAGDSVQIQNIGAGTLTITAGTATVNSAGSLAVSQYDGGFLYFSSASSAIWFDYTQPGTTSPLTTKGDLYTRTSSADSRLAVGANGTTLVADSAEATGLKWAAAASGGGMTLLSTTSLTSGSSVTISSISGSYKNLFILGRDISLSANDNVNFRFNSDTGSNYAFGRIRLTDTTLIGYSIDAETQFEGLEAFTSSAWNKEAFFEMTIPRYSETEIKSIYMRTIGQSPTVKKCDWRQGSFNSTSAISSVTLFTGGATYSSGTVYVYGVS